METRTTLRPSDKGTRKLAARFGSRLVCVRYRYVAIARRRCTTVELVVAEGAWTPRERAPRQSRSQEEIVRVRVAYGEEDLRSKLKALGALWRPAVRIRELSRGAARALGIEDRVAAIGR